jgi:hypothetical protein
MFGRLDSVQLPILAIQGPCRERGFFFFKTPKARERPRALDWGGEPKTPLISLLSGLASVSLRNASYT